MRVKKKDLCWLCLQRQGVSHKVSVLTPTRQSNNHDCDDNLLRFTEEAAEALEVKPAGGHTTAEWQDIGAVTPEPACCPAAVLGTAVGAQWNEHKIRAEQRLWEMDDYEWSGKGKTTNHSRVFPSWRSFPVALKKFLNLRCYSSLCTHFNCNN